jgi:hypothetical protein
MSHLERDIKKGKFGNNPQLKKEAREEEAEEKVEKKTGKHVKIREIAGKMKVKENPLFESPDKTIKRIKNDWDSRYD